MTTLEVLPLSGRSLLVPDTAATIRATLRREEGEALVCPVTPGTHRGDHSLPVFVLPYADALAVARAELAALFSSVVALECRDGFVLTVRGDWVASPGITYPVAEALEPIDANGPCVFAAGAARGLMEELGVVTDGLETVAFHADASYCIGLVRAETTLWFADIIECWRSAEHRDEGTPILVPGRTETQILRGLFPWIVDA